MPYANAVSTAIGNGGSLKSFKNNHVIETYTKQFGTAGRFDQPGPSKCGLFEESTGVASPNQYVSSLQVSS